MLPDYLAVQSMRAGNTHLGNKLRRQLYLIAAALAYAILVCEPTLCIQCRETAYIDPLGCLLASCLPLLVHLSVCRPLCAGLLDTDSMLMVLC